MKITYQPNPLSTIVELDDNDRERLRLKLIIEDMEERIYGAHFHLEPGERFDPALALRRLNVAGLEDEPLNKRIDSMMEWFINDLQDKHCGDCVCFPSSCTKCHAETLLGINTIPGLGKHSANKIDSAFSNGRTLDQAIEHLANYDPKPNDSWKNFPQETFDRHVPRWRKEAAEALEWLKDYQQKHFSGE